MRYEVKTQILGFEDIKSVEFSEIDNFFATIKSVDNESISFSLVNPYALREYSFDLPKAARILLDINETSNVLVYNIMVVQNPLEESKINFLAPLVFNQDSGLMGQVVLRASEYPTFGLAEMIGSFNKVA
jgi:flagellar assembly factor FliW